MCSSDLHVRLPLPLSVGHGLEIEFDELPHSDSDLEDWLLAQPGVVRVAIMRDNKVLVVNYILAHNLGEDWPPLPKILEQCALLGYTGGRERPQMAQ